MQPESTEPAVGPSSSATLRERLPAAVVCLWPDRSQPEGGRLFEETCAALCARAGTPLLESRLVAVLPEAGDPSAFDAAFVWLQEALNRLCRDSGLELDNLPLRALIFPSVVSRRGDRIRLLPDPLLGDLLERWPDLSAPGVFLTTHASRMLELPMTYIRAGEYRGPSGHTVPIVMADGRRADLPPWRNPELLGRRLPAVRRPEAEKLVAELLALPAAALSGPLGSGKSRLVWELLRRRSERSVWLRAQPERRARPTLADQLLQQLMSPNAAESNDPLHPGGLAPEHHEEVRNQLAAARLSDGSPGAVALAETIDLLLQRLATKPGERVRIVVDDLERLGADDARFLAALLDAPSLGDRFRVLMVGRPEGWRDEVAAVPLGDLPAFSEAQKSELAAVMVDGLSVPDTVRDRFRVACGANPFAFEEGLFGLLHERNFRRVYGSFFFGGDEGTEYRPSLRLVRHVLAEAARLRADRPLQLLSLADDAVPAEELGLACAAFGAEADTGWADRTLAAGLTRELDSPWGSGLEFELPALRYSMSFTVADEEASRVRHEVGQLLASRSQGTASWYAYRLLAGSPEAIAPLLAAASGPDAGALPREELMACLGNELHLHRLRGGDERVETKLLWRLLPLARRMGALQRFRPEFDRALALTAEEPNRLLAIAGIKAELEHEAGESQEAEQTIRHALKAASGSDQSRQALLLIQLGRILLRQGRPRDARQVFESLLPALQESGSRALGATCRFFLGNIALQEGGIEEAWQHHWTALETREALGLKRPSGSSHSALGAVALALGNYPRALAQYRTAHTLLEEFGQEGETSFALLGAGRALSRLGDFAGASKPLREALALRAGRDDRAGEAIARLAVAANYVDLGKLEPALEEARKASFELSLLSLDDSLADAEQLLGRIAFIQRRYSAARRHFAAALALHGKQEDELEIGFDHSWLLAAALAESDAGEVSRQVAELKTILGRLPRVDLAEVLNFRVFEGLDWLSRNGQKVGDPTPYLERAYRQVLDKAQHLEPDRRNRFLSQIPVNQEIVEVATQRGAGA